MKQKKWRIPILVLVLLVQLLAPVGLITYHRQLNRNIETKGEIYRIAVSITRVCDGNLYYDLVDSFIMHYDTSTVYFILDTDENGITHLSNSLSEKPPADMPYIRCVNQNTFPFFCNYPIEDTSLDYSGVKINLNRLDLYSPELIAQQLAVAQKEWYLELSVYKGIYTVRGIFDENGVPCEEILRQVL